MDVFVPAALESQITLTRAKKMDCWLIIETANGPTKNEADRYLTDNQVENYSWYPRKFCGCYRFLLWMATK